MDSLVRSWNGLKWLDVFGLLDAGRSRKEMDEKHVPCTGMMLFCHENRPADDRILRKSPSKFFADRPPLSKLGAFSSLPFSHTFLILTVFYRNIQKLNFKNSKDKIIDNARQALSIIPSHYR